MRGVTSLLVVTLGAMNCGSSSTDTLRPGKQESAVSPEDQVCARTELEVCRDSATCAVLQARRWDNERQCWAALEPVACRVRELICGQLTTPAIDGKRQCWLFSSTCLPVGWFLLENHGACGNDAPLCK